MINKSEQANMNLTKQHSKNIFKELIPLFGSKLDPSEISLPIIKKGLEYYENKRNERIYDFHYQLFLGTADEERIIYEDELIRSTEDDYYGILSAAISDEEEKKTFLYVNFYKSMLKHKVKQDDKIKYLKILKQLPFSAFKIIQTLHILSWHQVQYRDKRKTTQIYFEELEKDQEMIFELNALKNLGLIYTDTGSSINKLAWSNLCVNAVKLFYKEEDLVPESIGLKSWDFKLSLIEKKVGHDILNYIPPLLHSRNIMCERAVSIERYDYPPIIDYDTICLLKENDLDDSYLNYLISLSKKVKVYKLTFEKDLNDPLPEIEGKLIYLEKGNKDSERLFLEHLLVPLGKKF